MSNEQSTSSSWTPMSWHGRPARFQPEYSDSEAYAEAVAQLRGLPPLVFPGEVEHLRSQIAEAAAGRQFILQGGDCVERFIDCNDHAIANKLKILLQMSVILSHAARMPVLRIGRIAGQFFKPRSSATETIDGTEYLTYRGDTVNGFAPAEREPRAERLV
ncbi:MAG: 3-deoxy-7-phosphoheptulonate synthase, partial [Spirochaetales bacterium]